MQNNDTNQKERKRIKIPMQLIRIKKLEKVYNIERIILLVIGVCTFLNIAFFQFAIGDFSFDTCLIYPVYLYEYARVYAAKQNLMLIANAGLLFQFINGIMFIVFYFLSEKKFWPVATGFIIFVGDIFLIKYIRLDDKFTTIAVFAFHIIGVIIMSKLLLDGKELFKRYADYNYERSIESDKI